MPKWYLIWLFYTNRNKCVNVFYYLISATLYLWIISHCVIIIFLNVLTWHSSFIQPQTKNSLFPGLWSYQLITYPVRYFVELLNRTQNTCYFLHNILSCIILTNFRTNKKPFTDVIKLIVRCIDFTDKYFMVYLIDINLYTDKSMGTPIFTHN